MRDARVRWPNDGVGMKMKNNTDFDAFIDAAKLKCISFEWSLINLFLFIRCNDWISFFAFHQNESVDEFQYHLTLWFDWKSAKKQMVRKIVAIFDWFPHVWNLKCNLINILTVNLSEVTVEMDERRMFAMLDAWSYFKMENHDAITDSI